MGLASLGALVGHVRVALCVSLSSTTLPTQQLLCGHHVLIKCTIISCSIIRRDDFLVPCIDADLCKFSLFACLTHNLSSILVWGLSKFCWHAFLSVCLCTCVFMVTIVRLPSLPSVLHPKKFGDQNEKLCIKFKCCQSKGCQRCSDSVQALLLRTNAVSGFKSLVCKNI